MHPRGPRYPLRCPQVFISLLVLAPIFCSAQYDNTPANTAECSAIDGHDTMNFAASGNSCGVMSFSWDGSHTRTQGFDDLWGVFGQNSSVLERAPGIADSRGNGVLSGAGFCGRHRIDFTITSRPPRYNEVCRSDPTVKVYWRGIWSGVQDASYTQFARLYSSNGTLLPLVSDGAYGIYGRVYLVEVGSFVNEGSSFFTFELFGHCEPLCRADDLLRQLPTPSWSGVVFNFPDGCSKGAEPDAQYSQFATNGHLPNQTIARWKCPTFHGNVPTQTLSATCQSDGTWSVIQSCPGLLAMWTDPMNIVRLIDSKQPIVISPSFVPWLTAFSKKASDLQFQVYVEDSVRQYTQILTNIVYRPSSNSAHYLGHAIDVKFRTSSSCYTARGNPLPSEIDSTGSKCISLTALANQKPRSKSDPVLSLVASLSDPAQWGGNWGDPDAIHFDDRANKAAGHEIIRGDVQTQLLDMCSGVAYLDALDNTVERRIIDFGENICAGNPGAANWRLDRDIGLLQTLTTQLITQSVNLIFPTLKIDKSIQLSATKKSATVNHHQRLSHRLLDSGSPYGYIDTNLTSMLDLINPRGLISYDLRWAQLINITEGDFALVSMDNSTDNASIIIVQFEASPVVLGFVDALIHAAAISSTTPIEDFAAMWPELHLALDSSGAQQQLAITTDFLNQIGLQSATFNLTSTNVGDDLYNIEENGPLDLQPSDLAAPVFNFTFVDSNLTLPNNTSSTSSGSSSSISSSTGSDQGSYPPWTIDGCDDPPCSSSSVAMSPFPPLLWLVIFFCFQLNAIGFITYY